MPPVTNSCGEPDLNVGVPGTPTIVAVDASGVARRVWVGFLAPEIEGDVLRMIETRSFSLDSIGSDTDVRGGSRNYSLADLQKMRMTQKIQLIDTHERGNQVPQDDVITMPLLEMSSRAPYELDKTGLQVIDCSNLIRVECDAAVAKLSGLGFEVATLNAGAFYKSCETVAPAKPD